MLWEIFTGRMSIHDEGNGKSTPPPGSGHAGGVLVSGVTPSISLPGLGRPIDSRETCSANTHGAGLSLNFTSTLGGDNKSIIMIMTTRKRAYLPRTALNAPPLDSVCPSQQPCKVDAIPSPHRTDEKTKL